MARRGRVGIAWLPEADLLGSDADADFGLAIDQATRGPDERVVAELHRGIAAVLALHGAGEQVAHAEEPGHEWGHWPLVQALRVAELFVAAAVHDGDPIGHRHRLFLVVGHVDEGDPDLLLDPLELDLHLLAQLQIERPERFVQEQDRRPVDQRTGERDALRLAARDLRRLARLEARELDEGEHLPHPGLHLAVLDALATQPEGDVLVDRQVREERVVLEDRVHVPPVRRQPRHVLAMELDQPGRRLFEAADHPQGGRLAAAGGTEEAEELGILDLEVDVVDGDHIPELLDDVGQPDLDRHGRVALLLTKRDALTPFPTRAARRWGSGVSGAGENRRAQPRVSNVRSSIPRPRRNADIACWVTEHPEVRRCCGSGQ